MAYEQFIAYLSIIYFQENNLKPTDNTGNQILEVIADANHFNKWMYQTVKPYLSGNVLEIGSGIGNISSFLLKDDFKITLSDIDQYYVETLRKKFGASDNLEGVFSIDLLHSHFSLTYETHIEKYDTIFLLNVLEHIQDDEEAIKNCSSLLTPGGKLIILTPAYSFLYATLDKELGHYRRYTVNRLKKLFTHNQLNTQKGFYFNSLGIVAWLYSKILRLKSIPSKEMKMFNRLVPISKFIDTISFRRIGLSVIVVGKKIYHNS